MNDSQRIIEDLKKITLDEWLLAFAHDCAYAHHGHCYLLQPDENDPSTAVWLEVEIVNKEVWIE